MSPRTQRRVETFATEKARETRSRWSRVTGFAFILLLALIAVRALTSEIIRDPVEISPGMVIAPRSPGAGTALMLDLAMWVPALLVLLRGVFDRNYKLKFATSFVPIALLAIWSMISLRWSSDKFMCVIEAAQLITAVVVCFAMTQLVRSWAHVRIVAALLFGLLVAYLAHGAYYKTLELPEVRQNFIEHRTEILKERNWEPESFAAKQFERKVMAGDMVGFHASPNSFAAVVVVMLVVTLGLIADRIAAKQWGLAVPLMMVVPGAIWLIAVARARTSGANAVMAAILLLALIPLRKWLASHWKLVVIGVFAVTIAAATLIVAYGTTHNNLVNDSLTFRWRYWVASTRMFEQHPLFGVGYGSFGDRYLAVREPAAAEEIRDPHNFVVRTASELGTVGLVLLIAWLVLLVVESCRHGRDSVEKDSTNSVMSVRTLMFIAILGLAISLSATVDWSQPWFWTFLETIRRVMLFLLVLGGLLLAAIKSAKSNDVEDRESRWILYGLVLAIGTFAIANAMDFSGFEAGPMFLCFMSIGTVLGVRTPENASKRFASIALTGGSLAWIAGIVFLAIPIATAEGYQHDAETALRNADFNQAFYDIAKSKDWVSYNNEYYQRAARVLSYEGQPAWEVANMLRLAEQANPYNVQTYLLRGRWQLSLSEPNVKNALDDFAKAVQLNPNDLEIRQEYARTLERAGKKSEAREQFEKVLNYNDLLDATEPKRLTSQQIAEINAKINELSN